MEVAFKVYSISNISFLMFSFVKLEKTIIRQKMREQPQLLCMVGSIVLGYNKTRKLRTLCLHRVESVVDA